MTDEQSRAARHGVTTIGIALTLVFAAAGAFADNHEADQVHIPIESDQTPDLSRLQEITTVEGITEYRLDNGLQVLLFPDQTQSTFTVNVTYRVGSRHEGRGEKGMAHLLEHMVFKGTPTYDNIWGALDDHGANRRFNGTTWVDRTNYYETLPTSPENLQFALHMEADRMVNSLIAKEELDKEMTVVRNEFEMGENSPISVLLERMMSTAFLWHNYGNSTIGNRSDIERVPVENLRRFYRKYYQPDNATLVIAGKYDVEAAKRMIVQYFGTIPRSEIPREDPYTVEPTQDGERIVELKRVGDVAAAGAVYHIPSGAHPDYPAVSILNEVLSGEPSGRVYKALVEPGLASQVFGIAFAWHDPGVSLFLAEVRKEQDPHAALDEMTSIIEGFAETEISEEEVERVKTRMLKDIKLALTQSGRVGVQLSEWVAIGDWRMYFIHRDRIKDVTVDDVRRVAAAYFMESNRTAGVFTPVDAPVRAEIPETPDLAQFVDGYTGTETIEMGEAFDATPENIEARTKRTSAANGMQLALLGKENRGNSVVAKLRFHYGSEKVLAGHRRAFQLIPSMLMHGTTSKNHEQLADAIDQLQSRIGVDGGPGSLSASITSDRDNIVAAIELLGEILREPAFDAEEFAIVKKEELASLEQGLSDPQGRARNAMSRALRPFPADSYHYVPTIEERIEQTEALTVETLRELHAEIVGGGNAYISIVGDFDEDAVVAALESAFGDWQAKTEYERVARPYIASSTDADVIQTPDKEMAVVLMGTTLEMRDDHPDYHALAFGNYILGESSKSRLLNRLRHEGGLSYGAGSWFDAHDQDVRAAMGAYAICAPQNAREAADAMREEITKFLESGITEEELTDGKMGYRAQLENDLTRDAFVADRLAAWLEIDRTMETLSDHLAKVDALSASDVQEAMKRHLGATDMFEIMAGDLVDESAAAGGSD